mgnify:CR=1 FL=1
MANSVAAIVDAEASKLLPVPLHPPLLHYPLQLVIVEQKESLFNFMVDFLFMPVVAVGKWLAGKFSRINVFIFILDFIIETPFKVFVEIEQKTEVGGDGGNDDKVFDHTFYTCGFRFVVYGNQFNQKLGSVCLIPCSFYRLFVR